MTADIPFEYRSGRWESVLTPQPIEWRKSTEMQMDECLINGLVVAWIEKRPRTVTVGIGK